jgi:hypothetical protein
LQIPFFLWVIRFNHLFPNEVIHYNCLTTILFQKNLRFFTKALQNIFFRALCLPSYGYCL